MLNLNSILVALAALMALSQSAFASPCSEADGLFEKSSAEVYSCKSSSNADICIVVGKHQALNMFGLRIFELQPNGYTNTDVMMFDDSKWHGCFANIFGGCVDQSVTVSSGGIFAKKYAAPSVALNEKQTTIFDLTDHTGEATVATERVSGQTGQVIESNVEHYYSCGKN